MRRLQKENHNTIKFWNDYYSIDRSDADRKVSSRARFYKAVAGYLLEGNGYLSRGKPRLLDVGCGFGIGLRFIEETFPEFDLFGLDYSKHACDLTKKRVPKAKTFCVDLSKEDIPGKYDYILLLETLEHFDHPELILNKCLNACRKLLITVPLFEEEKCHVYVFDESSFDSYNVIDKQVIRHGKNLVVALKGTYG